MLQPTDSEIGELKVAWLIVAYRSCDIFQLNPVLRQSNACGTDSALAIELACSFHPARVQNPSGTNFHFQCRRVITVNKQCEAAGL